MKAVGGLLLVVASVVLVSGPATAAPPTCHGVRATIVGTRHADVIRGTRHRDVIVAGRGNDVVKGRGGNDLICGGPGADRLLGGAGRDHLLGQGDEHGRGEPEACDHGDTLDGGRGDDVIDPGRDLHAGYGPWCRDQDEVQFRDGGHHGVHVNLANGRATGQGRDRIVAGYSLSVVGSDRDDFFRGTDLWESFNGRGGNDTVRAKGGDDLAIERDRGSNGDDVYDMGDGADIVITSHGHDKVLAGAGDDELSLQNPVRMAVDGGDDDDVIFRAAVRSGETVTGGAGVNELNIILRDAPGPQAVLDIPGGTITVDGVSTTSPTSIGGTSCPTTPCSSMAATWVRASVLAGGTGRPAHRSRPTWPAATTRSRAGTATTSSTAATVPTSRTSAAAPTPASMSSRETAERGHPPLPRQQGSTTDGILQVVEG